ncbi:MAG: hypothetical protein HF314_00700 [Ignavibacteria bacterium]|nr:hypothetical protein [Ignavibacteria bacterium]MCU7501569.1 hypothetical protein [Ignavibacteria bacterium]MCU7517106.1 hypothetical protein [Ignavibacteria bacterium]
MKKGCFVTAIIFLTILIGSAIYVFKNHKDRVILWVKPFIVNNIRSKTDDELNKFKDTQYRDTLRAIIKDYVKLVKNNDSYDLKKGQDFLDEIQFILHRKQIDSTDIRKLTEFLNKEKLAYERSEKNGN